MCRRLANPASTGSLPTSAMQEDHVSMGWSAGLKLRRVLGHSAIGPAIIEPEDTEPIAGLRTRSRSTRRTVPDSTRGPTRRVAG